MIFWIYSTPWEIKKWGEVIEYQPFWGAMVNLHQYWTDYDFLVYAGY
jgi:hypothetical protein